MSDEMEATLRKSLDAVDRGRRLAAFGVAALFVAMAVAVAALLAVAAHIGSNPSSDALLLKSLYVVSAAQMLFVACCTAVVMFSVTRTAKAVLRSINPARGDRPER